MTKGELIEQLYNKHGDEVTKKLLTELVDDVFENIAKSIKKQQRFAYPQFGTFTLRKRKKRQGRNPQTGEAITIKASKTVGFKPSKSLKERL